MRKPDPKVLRYLESDAYLEESRCLSEVYTQPMFMLKEDHETCSCNDPFDADWDWEMTSTVYVWFADIAERYATTVSL